MSNHGAPPTPPSSPFVGPPLRRPPDHDSSTLLGGRKRKPGGDRDAAGWPNSAPPLDLASVRQGQHFGEYELIAELARGGMGVVFKARHRRLNRLVALKMILAGPWAGESLVQRFRTEVLAAARLDHPGIVPVYEVGEINQQHFYAMALMEGGSLASRLRQGPLPPREAATYMLTVALAVHYAHSRNIVHRDLKPGNVLLDANGEPKVSDFGIAKLLDQSTEMTAVGQVVGTMGYMAPEQAAGKLDEIGPLTDVFALGATLYSLLTQHPPHDGDDLPSILAHTLNEEPIAPSKRNPAVDRDLDTICLTCLQKDPHKRYGSARALAEDLERWRAGEPIAARPAGRAERLLKWVRRSPTMAGLWAMGVVVVLLLAVGGPVWAWREKHLRDVVDAESQSANQARIALAEEKRTSDRVATRAVLEQGRASIESKAMQKGLLLLGQAHRMAPEEDEELRQSIRRQFVLAQMTLPRPRLIIPAKATGNASWARYSLDGSQIWVDGENANAPGQRVIRVLDATTGQLAAADIAWHEASFCRVPPVPCADGKTLWASTATGVLKLQIATGEIIGQPMGIKNAALSPDGSRAFRLTQNQPVLAALPVGQPFLKGTLPPPSEIAGELWDLRTGRRVGQPLLVHSKEALGPTVFSANGKVVLRLDYGDSPSEAKAPKLPGKKQPKTSNIPLVLRRWDAETGAALTPLQLPRFLDFLIVGRPLALRYFQSSDDRFAYLMLRHNNLQRVAFLAFGTANGEAIGNPWGDFPHLSAIALSKDGQTLATASSVSPLRNRPLGAVTPTTIHLWRLPKGPQTIPGWDIHAAVDSMEFSPDGRSLLVRTLDAVVVYDLDAIRPRALPAAPFPVLASYPTANGSLVRVTTRDMQWFDRDLRPTKKTIPLLDSLGQTARFHVDNDPDCVARLSALSPDGKMLATGDDRLLCRWDALSGQAIGEFLPHPEHHDPEAKIRDMQFSPDGKVLLVRVGRSSAASFRTKDGDLLYLWDAGNGTKLGEPIVLAENESAISLGLQGTLLRRLPLPQRGHRDDAFSCLTLRTGEQQHLKVETSGEVALSGFGPNGKTLFTVELSGEGQFRDATTLAPLGSPLRGRDRLKLFAYHPRGDVLVTSGGVQIRFWTVPEGRMLGQPLLFPTAVFALAFSPDGERLTAVGVDGLVRVWDLKSRLPRDPERLRLAVEAATGLSLDDKGNLVPLGLEAWRERLALVQSP